MERYYVVTIQHNKEKDAENRTVPKAYDTLNEATREFHRQLGEDMNNATLDWSVCLLFDKFGAVYRSETWERPIVVESEPIE